MARLDPRTNQKNHNGFRDGILSNRKAKIDMPVQRLPVEWTAVPAEQSENEDLRAANVVVVGLIFQYFE